MRLKKLLENKKHKNPYTLEDKKQMSRILSMASVEHRDDTELLDTIKKVLSHIDDELKFGI